MQYYIGPKKYGALSRHGQHMVDVMEFGFWAPVGKMLLQMMNGIHRFLWPHNYGIAIILLTIIIRVVFWPVTHKSTESMRKMQEIQPLVTAVRQKYKDKPQKQQQEIMALYKEHKVNPLGGCLPMLIQIPVFIALFVVLRSAIELRFARFLWIRDLSEPENLLAGVLPFGLSLNILPVIMAATMAWQQKLTPVRRRSQPAEDDDVHAGHDAVPVLQLRLRPGPVLDHEPVPDDRAAVRGAAAEKGRGGKDGLMIRPPAAPVLNLYTTGSSGTPAALWKFLCEKLFRPSR